VASIPRSSSLDGSCPPSVQGAPGVQPGGRNVPGAASLRQSEAKIRNGKPRSGTSLAAWGCYLVNLGARKSTSIVLLSPLCSGCPAGQCSCENGRTPSDPARPPALRISPKRFGWFARDGYPWPKSTRTCSSGAGPMAGSTAGQPGQRSHGFKFPWGPELRRQG
jgi:hypothetical protein